MIDTNVAVVANEMAPQADLDCVAACIDALEDVRMRRRVLIDGGHQILDEYRAHLGLGGAPGVGDAFMKWLWNNRANGDCCRAVTIHETADGSYEEFPGDPELATFDRSDRKFVAVVLASGESPPILNAVDSDWSHFQHALEGHGVRVDFLCPHILRSPAS